MLRATTSFFAGDRLVSEGQTVDPSDPVVTGREHLFAPDGIEQATAAPGERRSTPRRAPAKKKAGS